MKNVYIWSVGFYDFNQDGEYREETIKSYSCDVSEIAAEINAYYGFFDWAILIGNESEMILREIFK
ncbi:hypothetical protein [Limnoraphis robusta]|uniref:Uncharacterized protein n=1 Tax=Limnoraphis robusta CCNP1315 TaxID=3110306 RepID=A0ABU5U9T5_9CYAN|nr:hypothetical protein [Limnoraphis robusta]MEA5498019.1 hypothetical protein [Limnoraphis robusta BA-68 BA1]MEA5522868.1 hypothetical protein [Limnoraphis robusta CCNP1315]MEA5546870.1 hypothetical protein [Limnoraphis robusta CCNP1324]